MKVLVQLCPTLWDTMDCGSPDSFVHGIFQARILEWVAISLSRGSSRPRYWTHIFCTAGRFFTDWATRKPDSWLNKWWSESESHSVVSNSLRPHGLYSPWNSPGQNTGLGSHSLLQGIFPTQGLNPDLPHCRWILYQLRSYWLYYFSIIIAGECTRAFKIMVWRINHILITDSSICLF